MGKSFVSSGRKGWMAPRDQCIQFIEGEDGPTMLAETRESCLCLRE